MKGLFWKVWAVLLVLSIFWLGWCIKTSPAAQAQSGVLQVEVVRVSPLAFTYVEPVPIDIKKINGKRFGALQVSTLRPALPVEVVD